MAHLYQTEADRARSVPAGDGWHGLSVWEAIATAATHRDTGKSFGIKAWTAAGMEGSNQTLKSVRLYVRERHTPDTPPDATPEMPTVDGEGYAFHDKGNTASASGIIAQATRPTVDEVFTTWGIDADTWEVERMKVQEQAITLRLRHREIVPTKGGDGERIIRLDDVPHQSVNWLIGLTLRRRKGASTLRLLAADLIADLRDAAKDRTAPVPLRRRDPGPGHLAVLHAPDLHHAKIDTEGAAWDARPAFAAATERLLTNAAGYDPGRVLLTVGNDALNTDGSRRSTTRGTAQDGLGTWRNDFRAVVSMYRQGIDRALEAAPVTVVVVPGNHDGDACFYLGEVLQALYASTPHVEIVNTGAPRTYHLHGRCLLGMTHGDGCKIADLPRLMSEEAPEMWAEATGAREWLTGHTHGLRVQPFGSVIVRTTESLTPTDEWHASKGYTGRPRAAECLVYHPEFGRVATLADPFRPLAA